MGFWAVDRVGEAPGAEGGRAGGAFTELHGVEKYRRMDSKGFTGTDPLCKSLQRWT